MGASHGLLLCKYMCKNLSFKFYVCNPLTRQYLELPPLPKRITMHNAVGFRCYPLDPTSAEVEFMVFVAENFIPVARINTFKTHVFHSKTGKWESYDVGCPPAICRLSFDEHNPTVFCNGFFHWCPILPPVSIIAYDPINQPNACRLMQLPPTLLPNLFPWKVDHIGLTEGRIRIITRKIKQSGFFKVCEVIDYDKGIFDCIYHVEEPCNFDVTSRFLSQMNGEIVYLINWNTKELMLFNMNDKSQQQYTLNLSSICNKEGVCDQAIPFTMTPWPTPIPKLPVPDMNNQDVKE